MISKLQPNEIIVVGTNLLGIHSGGAAKQAYEQFGAELGIGEGLSGQCYCFPTLDEYYEQLPDFALSNARNRFYSTARALPEKTFLMTPVGTGIARFSHAEMRTLFTSVEVPANVVLPKEWL